jgi:membrane associated rhomboid family serine protease
MSPLPPPAPLPSHRIFGLPAVLAILLLACVIPELVLQGADLGLWGSARWRPLAYQNGAFWAGLLRGWTPNYAAQPATMFATYGFLHAGALHMVVNMMTLISLGLPIVARIGQRRFALLYAVSLLGGGIGFALLTASRQPMVGASGALFGLVGAWIVWGMMQAWRASTGSLGRLRVLGRDLLWPATILVLLNLAMLWISGGLLAWETHLGGFVAGALLAPFLPAWKASG